MPHARKSHPLRDFRPGFRTELIARVGGDDAFALGSRHQKPLHDPRRERPFPDAITRRDREAYGTRGRAQLRFQRQQNLTLPRIGTLFPCQLAFAPRKGPVDIGQRLIDQLGNVREQGLIRWGER